MDIRAVEGAFEVTLSRDQFDLLVGSLFEMLHLHGDKFDIAGYRSVEAGRLADEIASRVLAARNSGRGAE